jgi:hypothetical protein
MSILSQSEFNVATYNKFRFVHRYYHPVDVDELLTGTVKTTNGVPLKIPLYETISQYERARMWMVNKQGVGPEPDITN